MSANFWEIETARAQCRGRRRRDAGRSPTHHNNPRSCRCFLRIATELHLKGETSGLRLRAGSTNSAASSANEGISTRHNPEFTSGGGLYQATPLHRHGWALTEALIASRPQRVCGSTQIRVSGTPIDLNGPPAPGHHA